MSERLDEILRLSPCEKYAKDDIWSRLTCRDVSHEDLVTMLGEIVALIDVTHVSDYVEPNELHKPYTSMSNCKNLKSITGDSVPKRPMNAFFLWSKKNRMLMSLLDEKLQHATVSRVLSKIWKCEAKQICGEKYRKLNNILLECHRREFPEYSYYPLRCRHLKEKKKADKVFRALKPKPENSKLEKARESLSVIPVRYSFFSRGGHVPCSAAWYGVEGKGETFYLATEVRFSFETT